MAAKQFYPNRTECCDFKLWFRKTAFLYIWIFLHSLFNVSLAEMHNLKSLIAEYDFKMFNAMMSTFETVSKTNEWKQAMLLTNKCTHTRSQVNDIPTLLKQFRHDWNPCERTHNSLSPINTKSFMSTQCNNLITNKKSCEILK